MCEIPQKREHDSLVELQCFGVAAAHRTRREMVRDEAGQGAKLQQLMAGSESQDKGLALCLGEPVKCLKQG